MAETVARMLEEVVQAGDHAMKHWWSGSPKKHAEQMEMYQKPVWFPVSGMVLPSGTVVRFDPEDFADLRRFRWAMEKHPKHIYAHRWLNKPDGKRTVMGMHRHLNPDADMVDHKDGNGLNNRRNNLRPCDTMRNMQNMIRPRPNKTSKFKGVSLAKRGKPWHAAICVEKKRMGLGSFDMEEDAARKYDAAARKYFGEFARCNFPEGE